MDNLMNIDLAILYLTGQANSLEKQQFESWLIASPENRLTYQNWAESWKAAGESFKHLNPETGQAWENVRKNTVDKTYYIKTRRVFFQQVLKVAAAIIILVALGSVFTILFQKGIFQKKQIHSYNSGTDTMTVHLSDGSMIFLNTRSSLLVPKTFKKQKRVVYLVGEAFFDVAHDKASPFIVNAKNTATKVLGTSFNIRTRPLEHQVDVTLIKGKVAFYRNDKEDDQIILNPGQ